MPHYRRIKGPSNEKSMADIFYQFGYTFEGEPKGSITIREISPNAGVMHNTDNVVQIDDVQQPVPAINRYRRKIGLQTGYEFYGYPDGIEHIRETRPVYGALHQRKNCELIEETEYPDSFANYPESVNEKRSDIEENGGRVWTPRDVLIRTLREIDNGKQIDCLVIAMRLPDKPGVAAISYRQATPDTQTSLGVMFEAMQLMSRDR